MLFQCVQCSTVFYRALRGSLTVSDHGRAYVSGDPDTANCLEQEVHTALSRLRHGGNYLEENLQQAP